VYHIDINSTIRRGTHGRINKTKFSKENKKVYQNYKEAYNNAKDNANEKDLVLITGSAFLIGDILKEFY
jgi:folylpolyglutamate synthase/dihydropteroate synthase